MTEQIIIIIAVAAAISFVLTFFYLKFVKVTKLSPPIEEYTAMVNKWLKGEVKKQFSAPPLITDKKIYLAGAELCLAISRKTAKRMFVAAASTGDANVYLEMTNNKLGGFLDKLDIQGLRDIAQKVVNEGAALADNMPLRDLPPSKLYFITFFAVGDEGKNYFMQVPIEEIKKDMPFYNFYYEVNGLFTNIKKAYEKESEEDKFKKKYATAGRFMP